jgi:hypothetical protein
MILTQSINLPRTLYTPNLDALLDLSGGEGQQIIHQNHVSNFHGKHGLYPALVLPGGAVTGTYCSNADNTKIYATKDVIEQQNPSASRLV